MLSTMAGSMDQVCVCVCERERENVCAQGSCFAGDLASVVLCTAITVQYNYSRISLTVHCIGNTQSNLAYMQQ
jgi:hypothetical protein